MISFKPEPNDLLLLTGANGHIGLPVLAESLKSGLRVRCAVRSPEKGEAVLSNKFVKSLNAGDRVTTVVVPSITELGAYDEACKGVTHIIHLACPVSAASGMKDPSAWQDQIVAPSIQGTVGLLESAKKAGTVKRIALCNSVAGIVDLVGKFFQLPPEEQAKVVIRPQDRFEPVPGPYANAFHAYSNAKAATIKAAEEFAKTNPGFDLVHIVPSYVLGPNYFWTSKKDPNILSSSSGELMRVVLGTEDQELTVCADATVHIDDVAKVFVASLNPAVPGNSSFILSSTKPGTFEGEAWDTTAEIVSKHFPEAVEKGILPNKGKRHTLRIKVDSTETEKQFEFTHKGFEEQVKDVLEFYLALPENDP